MSEKYISQLQKKAFQLGSNEKKNLEKEIQKIETMFDERKYKINSLKIKRSS